MGQVFCPVGFGDEHAAADRTAFQILIPENLCFQRSSKGQDRPPIPFTADRERNRLRAGTGIAIVKGDTIPVIITAALPPDKGVCLFPLCRGHAVGRAVRLALQRRQVFIWVIFHVVPPFVFRCRSPRKGFLPHFCGVFLRWHANAMLRRERYSFSDGHSFFQGAAHR